jgi:hypothetical protein
MFVQVIQGKLTDPSAMRAAGERWLEQLAPGATGWLGTTSGVTEDGRFILLARFTSEDAAMRNSDRPEQGEWWAEMAKLFDGEPVFRDSTRVLVDVRGNPDDAGFVQVMQGGSSDPDRAWKLMEEDDTDWSAFRPDILGSISIGHADGRWTMVNYFTSEAEARAGEQKEAPAELQQQMEELMSLSTGEPEFLDITEPWFSSPR